MGAITYSSAFAEHWALEGIPEGNEEISEEEEEEEAEEREAPGDDSRTERAPSPEQRAETRTSGKLAMFPKAAAAATTLRRLSLWSFRSPREEPETAALSPLLLPLPFLGNAAAAVAVPTRVPTEIAAPMFKSKNQSLLAAPSAPARRTNESAGMKTW